MQNLYLPLKFPVNFFKTEFPKSEYVQHRQVLFDKSYISPDYVDLVNSLGLSLTHAEVFYSKPNIYYPIHQDQHTMTDFPKINFITGGVDSEMHWYKPKLHGKALFTTVQTKYLKYEPNEVELIHSTKLPPISLVQAAVPHNVTTNKVRWCVSTVYTHNSGKRKGKLLTWDEMATILRDYVAS